MIDSVWLKARADDVRRVDAIDPALYQKYGVKRGLRNADGTGVLVGLTTIGNVNGCSSRGTTHHASRRTMFSATMTRTNATHRRPWTPIA